jgi:hypothetical protein
VRVFEAASGGTIGRSWHDHEGDLEQGQRAEVAAKGGNGYTPRRSIDWQPSCSCDAGDPVPQTVLDPFCGAGTTLLVADRLGRNGLGVELNPTYAEMARKRIYNDAPLFQEQTA